MSHEQLFNYINEYYGLRGVFISELAKQLGISYRNANRLTIKAGYRRTKKTKNVTFTDFSSDKNVQYIASKI